MSLQGLSHDVIPEHRIIYVLRLWRHHELLKSLKPPIGTLQNITNSGLFLRIHYGNDTDVDNMAI